MRTNGRTPGWTTALSPLNRERGVRLLESRGVVHEHQPVLHLAAVFDTLSGVSSPFTALNSRWAIGAGRRTDIA